MAIFRIKVMVIAEHYEVSISHGSKVMAKVKILLIHTDRDRQAKNYMPKI